MGFSDKIYSQIGMYLGLSNTNMMGLGSILERLDDQLNERQVEFHISYFLLYDEKDQKIQTNLI